ncbi:Tol-Pal system beta propeller repeat protein TolB [Pelagibacteraceae bacterium]|nr:Tol-Pal system beta propeller repeat protein TolB [Pelagibacteraceae bacterium]
MKQILIFIILTYSISIKALEVTLTQGTIKPTPIAVTEFYTNNSDLEKIGKNVSNVISDNLERSGLFLSINDKSFIQDVKSLAERPRFEDWKIIKAQHLVAGRIAGQNGKISVEFRLYDVFQQKLLVGKKYETSEKNWRRVAHIVSDSIFKNITGEGGYFDTRIVYVAETGPKDNKQKRLAIMDQDQANHRFLTDGSYLVLTPRFSPNSQKITYMSYVNRNKPRVYIFDIETGKQEIVGEFPGMTFAPRFSPNGDRIVMSYTDPDVGNSEIYILDLKTRISERITNNSSIDVSASFSPDGKKIVFNSDRSGRRHLYVADTDGKNVKRISKERGSYYTPVWSPRGDMIAFTKQEGGQFYIGVMEKNGSNERMIAKSFHVEGPTWAPNGRFLMYFKEERTAEDGSGGESSLYFIDLTGYNERKVITPLGGSDPAWSPLMH